MVTAACRYGSLQIYLGAKEQRVRRKKAKNQGEGGYASYLFVLAILHRILKR